MAFRGRRGFRRRRFGRRAVARKEPIWIASAFAVSSSPNVVTNHLFQLIGPEDYTPDYASEPQRRDSCTLVRTVGHFSLTALVPLFTNGRNTFSWKAALFVAGDKQVDDGFANDPGQYDLLDPTRYVTFTRDYSPMHIFWSSYVDQGNSLVGGSITEFRTDIWQPPGQLPYERWDINVKRRMQGDDALFLLINHIFGQSPPEETGGLIEVESRCLIMDQ